MAYLDIIVPHCREPWETGKKFFDMLALQRGVRFADLRVILCQDGAEGALEEALFSAYPFAVERVLLPHAGVSAARNAGIRAARAPWIAFCDFDDMYSSALSLKVALEALRKAEQDGILYIWNSFLEEVGTPETRYSVYKHDWDATFIHGRFIWRQFLLDNDLRFNEALSFGEDQDFNTLCQIIAGEKRVGELKEPIYLWCENENSVTRREKDKTVFYSKMLEHRFATAEELCLRGIEGEYLGAVARCAMDAFFEMNAERQEENVLRCEGQFAAWWLAHRADFYRAPRRMLENIYESVREWANQHGLVSIERVTLGDWLSGLEQKYKMRDRQ